jgi:hypothetical protein
MEKIACDNMVIRDSKCSMKYDGFAICVGDINAITLWKLLIPNAILSHQHALVLLLNSLLGMSKEQDCLPKTTMMKLGKVEDKIKPKNK